MRTLKIRRWSGILFLCLLCLAGCGGEKAPADGQGEKTSAESQVSGSAGTPVEDDWIIKGFPASEKAGVESTLWAAEYVMWEHEDIGFDSSKEFLYEVQACIQGERIYRLCRIYPMEWDVGKSRNLLEIYDVSSGQTSLTEIDSEKLGVGNGSVAGMYVAEPGKYVFRIVNEEEQINKIVYTDLGDQTQIVDVMPAYLEKGISEKIRNECICDAEGNIYTRDIKLQELYILDREGSFLMEYKGGNEGSIRDPLRMPSGELLFPIYNNEEKSSQLVWFDLEQKKAHTISSFDTYPIEWVYGIRNNDIYYEAFEGIVKWNILSGDRTLVYQFDQNGISRIYRTMLVLREDQPPVLRMYGYVNGDEEDWLVTLSEEEAEPGEVIRVVSLFKKNETTFDAGAFTSTVSRKYRNAVFVFETYENADQEDYRTRILAELTAGGGPDILFVSLEDMRRLQSQGYLTDLRSVLSDVSLNRVIPTVIEMGTVDDTLVGLAPSMKASGVITLKDIWDKDTWTLEDVMDLMDTGEFTGVICQGPTGFAPRAVVSWLTMFGMRDSSLIDWKTRKSYFDSDHFIRMLHTAKTYSTVPWNQETWLGAGGCPMETGAIGIEGINEFYDQFGEEYFFIGFPANAGSGNYLDCDGVLVVNRKVSDTKAVSAFFEYLLREEVQDSHWSGLSILKISPEDVEYREEGGERKAYWKKHELRIKEDGTTTLEDYAAFLENCVPHPESAEENLILSIVWEEAESYIAGDKSAEKVAEIIQSRVQLYLDENR